VASLAGAACWYAERGHLVFPLRPGTKVPLTKNGFHDASMNPDTIRAWWTRTPQANIGLTTGHMFDVIDLDGPQGIRNAADIADRLPPTLGTITTPHGFHLYIRPTGDRCKNGFVPGIDYKGIGGYVVAPPSITLAPCDRDYCAGACKGVRYTWLEPMNL